MNRKDNMLQTYLEWIRTLTPRVTKLNYFMLIFLGKEDAREWYMDNVVSKALGINKCEKEIFLEEICKLIEQETDYKTAYNFVKDCDCSTLIIREA